MSLLEDYPPTVAAFNPAFSGCAYKFNPRYSYVAVSGTAIYEVEPSSNFGYWLASKKGAEGCIEMRKPVAHDALAYYLPEGLTWTKEPRYVSPKLVVKPDPATRDRVYFIEAIDFQRIKIGHSNNPAKRLVKLSAQSASPLRIRIAISGGEPLERQLHKRFASLRVHGEWFRFEGALKSYVESLQQKGNSE